MTPAEEVATGAQLPGTRYWILGELGQGGMAGVYSAEHIDIERRVAIKVVHREVVSETETLAAFRREARVAARIESPYTCEVTDCGELSDGRPFFVMELVDGASLGSILRREGRLPPGRCVAILRQIAKALDDAHRKGVVHLDVKPDNVLLHERGARADAVKLVDFGVAGDLGDSGCAALLMGTPEYMAPERITSERFDHRVDVYALGALAYEMLSGTVPLEGADQYETLEMQVSRRPVGVNERTPGRPVPAALERLIMAMLAKDPDRRPANMAEVEARLLEAQISAGIRTGWDDLPLPPMSPRRSARIVRRLRSSTRAGTTAVIASLAAIAVLAGMGIGVRLAHGAGHPPVVLPGACPAMAGSIARSGPTLASANRKDARGAGDWGEEFSRPAR